MFLLLSICLVSVQFSYEHHLVCAMCFSSSDCDVWGKPLLKQHCTAVKQESEHCWEKCIVNGGDYVEKMVFYT